MHDHIEEGQDVSQAGRALRDDIVGVAQSTSQGGMTLDDEEVRTLSTFLRRVPPPASPIVSDVHRMAGSSDQSGMTLEDDEVQALAAILADA